MGLPQQPELGAPKSQPAASDAESQYPAPRSASSLPPAALDLASKLFDFARQGKMPELEQYINAGIPVNLTNHKGDTLLMLSAYHGHLETTEMLITRGADVNVLNDRGQSPIAGAVFKGSDEVVRVLVEKGHADLYAGQPNAVDSARMFKREECLRLFGVDEGQ